MNVTYIAARALKEKFRLTFLANRLFSSQPSRRVGRGLQTFIKRIRQTDKYGDLNLGSFEIFFLNFATCATTVSA